MKKYQSLPVGITGTALGLCTLSNGYDSAFGGSLVRFLCMILGLCIWFLMFRKITSSFTTVKDEYMSNTVTATLYATFSMLLMIEASFIEAYIHPLGVVLWLIGIAIQVFLIIMLFTKHIFAKRNLDVILPSWYVTLLGLLVSTAIGSEMGFLGLKKVIVIYGFLMYFSTIGFVVYRLIKKDLPDPARYTKTILLAPIALIIVGYKNVFNSPNLTLAIFLYLILLVTMIYVLCQTKSFLRGGFTPGWAALTFPHAIAIIASLKTQAVFLDAGMPIAANIVYQIAVLQIFITTGIILFTMVNFLMRHKEWNAQEA